MDGQKVGNSVELRKILYSKKVGDSVTVKAYQDGKLVTKTMKLTSTISK